MVRFPPSTFLVLAFGLSLSAPARTQTVGGGFDLVYLIEADSRSSDLGRVVSGAGDLNGDGFHDFLIADADNFFGGVGDRVTAYSGADGSLLYAWADLSFYHYGFSASDAGDLNGDGFDDIVIGNNSLSPAVPGSALAYSGADGSQMYLWNGMSPGDYLGYAVSGAGDVNGDGFDDVILGAYGAEPGGLGYAGAAYVYSGADGSLLHQFDGTTLNGFFGTTVSGAGDLNGDGFADVLVGAYLSDPGGFQDAGSAFAYSGADGSLLFQWDGADYGDHLGICVSDMDDINGDGYPDVLIGADGVDVAGVIEAGVALIFSGADGSLLNSVAGELAYSSFGNDVSGTGDVDGDGVPDFLVTGYDIETGPGPNAGITLYSGMNGLVIEHWVTDINSWEETASGMGDIDGDGLNDLIIGFPGNSGWGKAYVYTFSPFMESDTPTISASTGGTVTLALDFPVEAALYEYKVLISKTGTGPSFYGVDIPLTRDRFLNDAFLGNYPFPTYTNLHGILDASGDAAADLTLPAGIPANLIGQTYYLAAIANPPSLLPEYSSVAVAVEITP